MVDGNSGSDEQSHASEPDIGSPSGGDTLDSDQTYHRLRAEFDGTCSTPYVSAPSSPDNVCSGHFFSAPASPLHFVLSSSPPSSTSASVFDFSSNDSSASGSFDFDFSTRFPSNSSSLAASMISADELFLNGQIRPMKPSSHLQTPQILAPSLNLEGDEDYDGNNDATEPEVEKREEALMPRLRNRSQPRRTRSLSPLRNLPSEWHDDEEERETKACDVDSEVLDRKQDETPSTETTPSVCSSSSRSSSGGRSSSRWIFLKDLLYRSQSEGSGIGKEKFWRSISFSAVKDKKPPPTTETQRPKRTPQVPSKKTAAAGKPTDGVGKRRIPLSPHELHYAKNRAQAEEMKKKTFLPYRQGLLGWFSSKSYGAMNGFARPLNPVSS